MAVEELWGPADVRVLGELYAPLRRFAAVIGRWDVEPDDLVQEAYTKVLRGTPSAIQNLGPYLRRTIANLATHSRRRTSRERAAASSRTGAARVLAVIGLLNALLIVAAFARLVSMTRLGPGPFLALAGAGALALASCLPVWARSSTANAHASQ